MSFEERRFVVLGKTGNGKSSSINTIVGKNVCPASASSRSVTKECKLVEETAHGKRLVIVDTPGLFDTESTIEETRKEIAKIIGLTSPGFHAFIVVIRIGRFTREEIMSIETLAEMFGPELYERAIVLFTGKDDLEADGVTFSDYIEKNITRELREFLTRCGSRKVAFNNRDQRDSGQVEILMGKIVEIVKEKGNSYYTNDMYEKANTILKEEEKRRLHEDKTKTIAQVRQDIRKDIAEENSLGMKILSFVIEKIAIPVADVFAQKAVEVATKVIVQRCTLS